MIAAVWADAPMAFAFVLLIFDINDGPHPKDGRLNYISNSDRVDVIATMKEVIARHEGRYHEPKEKQ